MDVMDLANRRKQHISNSYPSSHIARSLCILFVRRQIVMECQAFRQRHYGRLLPSHILWRGTYLATQIALAYYVPSQRSQLKQLFRSREETKLSTQSILRYKLPLHLFILLIRFRSLIFVITLYVAYYAISYSQLVIVTTYSIIY